MKKLLPALIFAFLATAASAQEVGDQITAGYTSSRTYLNTNQGTFRPPLRLTETVDLTGVTSAESLLVFTQGETRRFLVGEGTPGNSAYRLYNADTGAQQWSIPVVANGGPLNFVPSFSDDVVLLGGAATTAVTAVRVSNGAVLWTDNTVGDTAGRFPVLTNGLALYGGRNAVAAVDPLNGPSFSFWRRATTTAEAPISAFGQQAYFLEDSGVLRAVDVRTGVEVWSVPNLAGVNPNIIASEGLVFINTSVGGIFGAARAADGSGVWAQMAGELSQTPAMALAYDRLFVFTSDDGEGNAKVDAFNPNTGDPLWSVSEDGAGVDYGLAADNVIYYYHQATDRIRARDAFTGNLIWSARVEDVRALSAADGNLYALLANQVNVYEAVHEIYFAQIADGGGQRTLVTLNNLSSSVAQGVIDFFDDDGNPLPVALPGVGESAFASFDIAPHSTIGIQTMGAAAQGRPGWARATANQPISGSSVFQFATIEGEILAEAGVANSGLTGSGNTFVEIALPPDRIPAISTGVAVANPSDDDANVRYTLLDGNGTTMGVVDDSFAPGTHEAQFVEQIFPTEVGGLFTGTLVIEADVPVVVTTLRTQAGLQLSSYVVGQ